MFDKIFDWIVSAINIHRLWAAVILCTLIVVFLILIILAASRGRRIKKLKRALKEMVALPFPPGKAVETPASPPRPAPAAKEDGDTQVPHSGEPAPLGETGNSDAAHTGGFIAGVADIDGGYGNAPEDDGQEYEFEITDDDYAEDGGEAVYTDAEYGDDQALDGKPGTTLGKTGFKITVKYDRPKCSWVILGAGSGRTLRRVKTKDEAIKVAKEICQKRRAALSLHKKDGKFQKQNFKSAAEKNRGGKKSEKE